MLTASLLASLALKSLVLASVTLGLLRLARRRTPAERSLIAHFGLLAILLLPAASLALPEWAPLPPAPVVTELPGLATELPAAQTGAPPVAVAASETSPPALTLPSAGQLALWLYAIPVVAMFAMMALAVLRLFAMRRRAEVLVDGAWLAALAGAQRRMGYKHGTALLVSEELRSPISWGVLRPTILLDQRAVAAVDDAEAIIAHELAHVTRFDWAKLLIARLACTLFWFNPLVWLLARESHQLREEAADDTVLLTDIAGADYAALLVSAARHDNNPVLIAAHGVAPGQSSLRRRVVRVLDAHAPRGPARTGWGALSLLGVIAVAAPLAAFTTAATAPSVAPAGKHQGAAAPKIAERREEAGAVAPARRLSADDLVAMRAVGVEPADVERMRKADVPIDPDTIIAAKALAVDPDYIGAMRAVFGAVDTDELVGARAIGVDPEYARAMRAIDPRADLDEVIGARAIAVTPAYAQEMRRVFPRIALDELVQLRAVGVTAEYITAMREAGMRISDPDEAVEARALGGWRAPPRGALRPLPPAPPSVRASRDGRTAIVGPGGPVAISRNPDGSVSTATPPRPPGTDDER